MKPVADILQKKTSPQGTIVLKIKSQLIDDMIFKMDIELRRQLTTSQDRRGLPIICAASMMRRHLPLIAVMALMIASPTGAERFQGTYLCNWLVKLEDFFLCHNDKVRMERGGEREIILCQIALKQRDETTENIG